MSAEIIAPLSGKANLKDYDQSYATFHWKDVEKEFDWSTTGKVNIAHEAIDRHCRTSRRDKVALYFVDDNREVKYTFEEMRVLTNKLGNVLKKLGIVKGDRVFVFMPKTLI